MTDQVSKFDPSEVRRFARGTPGERLALLVLDCPGPVQVVLLRSRDVADRWTAAVEMAGGQWALVDAGGGEVWTGVATVAVTVPGMGGGAMNYSPAPAIAARLVVRTVDGRRRIRTSEGWATELRRVG